MNTRERNTMKVHYRLKGYNEPTHYDIYTRCTTGDEVRIGSVDPDVPIEFVCALIEGKLANHATFAELRETLGDCTDAVAILNDNVWTDNEPNLEMEPF
jgi:hypothetical protein